MNRVNRAAARFSLRFSAGSKGDASARRRHVYIAPSSWLP
jgi:hypothetical protein